MATMRDGRTADNGAAHLDASGASGDLASEIYLDRMLGWMRATAYAVDARGRAACLRMADACLDRALNCPNPLV